MVGLGYFSIRRDLKYAINDICQTNANYRLYNEKHQKRVKYYREVLEDPKFNLPLDHPKFRQAEQIKQEAYWLLGETKYLIHECNMAIQMNLKRKRFYERQMQNLID